MEVPEFQDVHVRLDVGPRADGDGGAYVADGDGGAHVSDGDGNRSGARMPTEAELAALGYVKRGSAPAGQTLEFSGGLLPASAQADTYDDATQARVLAPAAVLPSLARTHVPCTRAPCLRHALADTHTRALHPHSLLALYSKRRLLWRASPFRRADTSSRVLVLSLALIPTRASCASPPSGAPSRCVRAMPCCATHVTPLTSAGCQAEFVGSLYFLFFAVATIVYRSDFAGGAVKPAQADADTRNLVNLAGTTGAAAQLLVASIFGCARRAAAAWWAHVAMRCVAC